MFAALPLHVFRTSYPPRSQGTQEEVIALGSIASLAAAALSGTIVYYMHAQVGS